MRMLVQLYTCGRHVTEESSRASIFLWAVRIRQQCCLLSTLDKLKPIDDRCIINGRRLHCKEICRPQLCTSKPHYMLFAHRRELPGISSLGNVHCTVLRTETLPGPYRRSILKPHMHALTTIFVHLMSDQLFEHL